MRDPILVSRTDLGCEWDGHKSKVCESSLFAGLTFISFLTLTLCLLFGKLLRPLLRRSDTGDNVSEGVF